MLRSETLLPRRRLLLLLPAVLGFSAAMGAQLLMEGGHPLPAVRATVSRWALEHPSPALERLLGLDATELATLSRLPTRTTVHIPRGVLTIE